MSWIVLKFGGTSVSQRRRWENIAKLIRERHADGARVVTVVSAMSGVTDLLKSIATGAMSSAQAHVVTGAIIARHRDFAIELGLDPQILRERETALTVIVDDPVAGASNFAWAAELQAQGELLSSTLGAHFLRSLGLEVVWLDARDCLRAVEQAHQTEWARYCSALCHAHPNAVLASELAETGRVFLTQGFIARLPSGATALLGRGGSDTSASYFGALLGAERVEIWTDVPGMFSANPKLVPDARLLRRLDYDEAQEIATTGAKVLHPRAIGPVREARVPLWIKDTERPPMEGTIIGPEVPASIPSVKAISLRSGVTLVSMESIGMWQQVGFLADVFAIFKNHGLSVDLIGSAETNVTVSLDPSDNLLDSQALELLCADLAKVCRVKVIAPCAAVTLVGRGMRAMMYRLSEILAEIGARRVHLVSQSSNNLNLTFVIDESDADGVVQNLHALLVRARLTGVDGDPVFGPAWNRLTQPSADVPAPWWAAARASLIAQAEDHTPVYVYAASVIAQRAQQLKSIIGVDQHFYAIKANPHPEILRLLFNQGYGMECVSAGELEHVRAVLPEITSDRILFTPNFAARGEYALAFAMGVRVTVDNVALFGQWPGLFVGREILLRFDLGRGLGHHDKVKTGGDRAKFGIALADAALVRMSAQSAGATVIGLHAHLGSGILDAEHWKRVYADLASLAEQFPTVRVLDIGGGFGVPQETEQGALDIAALGQALAEVRRLYPRFEVWIEPGRFLVAEAGVLLARVSQIKHKNGVRFIGLDAGMHSLLRPALYDAWHEIRNLTRFEDAADGHWQVVGPICESSDVLGRDRALPASFEGDVFLIADAGAYGASMASRYNTRPLPLEVMRDDL